MTEATAPPLPWWQKIQPLGLVHAHGTPARLRGQAVVWHKQSLSDFVSVGSDPTTWVTTRAEWADRQRLQDLLRAAPGLDNEQAREAVDIGLSTAEVQRYVNEGTWPDQQTIIAMRALRHRP
jgi:hypothetical protein